MWTETSSFAGYTSTSESSNITKIPGVGLPTSGIFEIFDESEVDVKPANDEVSVHI